MDDKRSSKMKLKYIKHNEIDKKKWEYTISNAINGNLYTYAWYLDIVSPQWEALVLEDYELVFPLTVKKILGFNTLQQPPFAQQLGVFTTNANNLNKVEEIIQQAVEMFPYCNFQVNKHNFLQTSTKYTVLNKINYELDLIPSYEYLSSKYHTNTKRNIAKARSNNLVLKINDINPQTFVDFIRKNVGHKVTKLKSKDYQKILQIIKFVDKYKFGQSYSVYDDKKQLLSTAYFIFSHNKVYYLFAANSQIGKEKRAMFFLLDEFIRNYSEKNLILDFEGSMIPGLARYYEGFGAIACKYQQIISNRLPYLLRWIKKK
ncbi:MAG: hypothetical protein ACUVQP_02195 [Bacteroidales bacterium]